MKGHVDAWSRRNAMQKIKLTADLSLDFLSRIQPALETDRTDRNIGSTIKHCHRILRRLRFLVFLYVNNIDLFGIQYMLCVHGYIPSVHGCPCMSDQSSLFPVN